MTRLKFLKFFTAMLLTCIAGWFVKRPNFETWCQENGWKIACGRSNGKCTAFLMLHKDGIIIAQDIHPDDEGLDRTLAIQVCRDRLSGKTRRYGWPNPNSIDYRCKEVHEITFPRFA